MKRDVRNLKTKVKDLTNLVDELQQIIKRIENEREVAALINGSNILGDAGGLMYGRRRSSSNDSSGLHANPLALSMAKRPRGNSYDFLLSPVIEPAAP